MAIFVTVLLPFVLIGLLFAMERLERWTTTDHAPSQSDRPEVAVSQN